LLVVNCLFAGSYFLLIFLQFCLFTVSSELFLPLLFMELEINVILFMVTLKWQF